MRRSLHRSASATRVPAPGMAASQPSPACKARTLPIALASGETDGNRNNNDDSSSTNPKRVTAGPNVDHILVHTTDHFGSTVDQSHEVHRFHATTHSYTQPVKTGSSHRGGRDVVAGNAMIERRNGMRFHPDQRWMIQHADRNGTGPEEYKLIETKVQRQGDFAIGSPNV